MANRAMFQTLASLVERLTYLECRFTVSDGSGTPSLVQGSGIASVTRLQAGVYKVQLQDSYDKLLSLEAVQEEAPGTPITLNTGLTSNTVFEITTLGNDVSGKSTFTISSGSGILQATIGGFLVQVTWASSDNATATALAAAINANANIAALGVAVASTNTVVFTARGTGVVSTVAAGTGFTVGSATTTGQATIAAQWQAVGLPVGVKPAVGVAFKSNAAGAQAGADATAAAAPVAGTSTALGQVINLFGHPSTTIRAAAPGANNDGYFCFVVRSGIGVVTDPAQGSVVHLGVFLRNSSVKGKGE